MSIKEKIIELYNRGINLWSEDGNLHYKAAGQKLLPEDMEFLKKNKVEIIRLFESPNKIEKNYDRYTEYPLTDIQSAYLLGRGNNYRFGGVSSHVYFEVEFPKLEREEVEKAWNSLIQRHDNMRMVISETQKQRVQESVPKYEILWQDCENLEEIEEDNVIRKSLENKYYEIGSWPMYDIGVSQLKDKSIMHLSFDFLILDWTSIWILLKEFEQVYFNKQDNLDEVSYTFKHYYMDSLDRKKCSKYIVDEAYFSKKLNEYAEAPMLPVNFDDAQEEFQRISSEINMNEWAGLKAAALKEGITATIAVLTAFSMTLELWCEKPDFTVNLTTMNRDSNRKEIGSIVGDFTSINLLNVSVMRDKTFVENAKVLQKKFALDMEHNSFSGMEVLRELRKLHSSEECFYPIVFTSSIGSISAEYDYLKMGTYGVSQTPQVFMDCQVMEVNKKLHINLDIRKGIFPEGMIEHMMEKFCELLYYLAEQKNWSTKFAGSTLVKSEEQERNAQNQNIRNYEIEPLHKAIFENIKSDPESIAVVKGDRETSYGELGNMISGISSELRKSGMQKKDNVAIFMKHSSEAVAAILSVLNLGGSYVPIDYAQPEKRVNHIIEQADIHYVLTDDKEYRGLEEDVKVIVCDALESDATVEYNPVDLDDVAYIIFTSGTTGIPKGVEITHRAANNTILAINEQFHPEGKPVVLGLSKLNFDLSVYDIFGILAMGGTLVYPDEKSRLDPSHWKDLILRYHINMWNTVPAFMQLLVSYCKEQKIECSFPLEKVLLSGDWIPVTLPSEIKQIAQNVQVISLGGATEAAIWSIYHVCQDGEENGKSILYGVPLPNQTFHVLDSDLRDRPVWTAGELYIGGIGLAQGYLGDEEKTKESFIIHPVTKERLYKTGDYGRYVPGGEIEFLGRRDNQVKINGFRIELGEIEAALLKTENVSTASVIVDSKNGEKNLVGFICPKSKEETSDITSTQFINDIAVKKPIIENSATEEKIKSAIEKRDLLSIHYIVKALKHYNLFNHNDQEIQEMIDKVEICEKNQWIISYWLTHLTQNGYVTKDEAGNYNLVGHILEGIKEEELVEITKAEWEESIGDVNFINYIVNAGSAIIACLEGKVDPVSILYPDGGYKMLDAIYENNIFSKYFNRCIADVILSISQLLNRPVRVLEVGAGTGKTSKNVLKTLTENNVDYEYYFTDVAKSFLAQAKTTLKEYPGVKYLRYDMNEEFSTQGLIQNEFDIVLAVGVLENAKNIPKTMNSIKNLVSANGWFLFTEPIREEPWILASQIFMMERPQDTLRNSTTYLSQKEWEALLKEQEGKYTVIPSEENSCYSEECCYGNMKLFIKQFHAMQDRIEPDQILDKVKEYVPDYMVPRKLFVLNQMPLNENGKVDRKKLLDYSATFNSRKTAENTQVKEKEERIDDQMVADFCKILSAVLGVEKTGSKENLYELGADSLLLAQAAGKVRDYVSSHYSEGLVTFDMILKQLLNRPTVEELAKYVSEKTAEKEDEQRTVNEKENVGKATLYGGGTGTLRVVFHAGFGTVNIMKKVIDCLVAQNKGPVMAITVENEQKYLAIAPEKLVTTICEEYAGLILAQNPERVQLIGYCQGGLLALETAYHILNAGVEIADIALIDSYSAPVRVEDALIVEMNFLTNYGMSYEKIYPEVKDAQLMTIIKKLIRESGNVIKEEQLRNFIAKTEDVEPAVKNLVERLSGITEEQRFQEYTEAIVRNSGKELSKEMLLNFYKINMASWKGANMTPIPYLGAVRYFMAEERMDYLFADAQENLGFWQSVCLGEFTVLPIKGNHVTCVKVRENAEEIAKKLEEMV